MLIVASTGRDLHPATGPTASVMDDYMRKQDESKIVSMQAAQSHFAISGPLRSSSGAKTGSIETSLLVQQDDSTKSSSLSALSRTLSSCAKESVSTGMGGRDPDEHDMTSHEPWRSGILRCPFRVLNCHKEFNINHKKKWEEHSLTHLMKKPRRGGKPVQVHPPKHCRCYFCGAEFRAASGNLCFRDRMSHINHHHGYEHHVLRQDFALNEYLWEVGIMPLEIYRELKPTHGLPTPPSSDDGRSPVAFRGETR